MNSRLITARNQSGLTQLEVAERVGIVLTAYQRYEYGKRLPNVLIALRIAKVLNCEVKELWGQDAFTTQS